MANTTQKTTGRDKRERLVASAVGLINRQGIEVTTLAEIAADADVPLGNVYYYFKTREELIAEVIDAQSSEVKDLIGRLERRRSPAARLKGLIATWAASADMVAVSGCPIGTLSSELVKHCDHLQGRSGEILEMLVDWAQTQFVELGLRDSRELALTLVGAIQGAAVLAGAMHDPKVLTTETRRLNRWIDSLA